MKKKPKVQGGLSPATSTPGTYSLDQNGPSKTDTASGEKDRADKDALVQDALLVARRASDAQLMSELRVQLEALASKPDMLSLNRENAVRLLNIILKWLGPAMKINIGMVAENIPFVIDHDSINLLIDFVDALKDLDNGKTHEAFKPNPCGSTASLTTAERKRDDALVELVRIIESAEGLNSRSEAEAILEKRLDKAGALRRNKPITAKILKSLSDRNKRRKVPHK